MFHKRYPKRRRAVVGLDGVGVFPPLLARCAFAFRCCFAASVLKFHVSDKIQNEVTMNNAGIVSRLECVSYLN